MRILRPGFALADGAAGGGVTATGVAAAGPRLVAAACAAAGGFGVAVQRP